MGLSRGKRAIEWPAWSTRERNDAGGFAGQPFGPYLLLLVAAGLAAYGIFALVEARYRRMVVR